MSLVQCFDIRIFKVMTISELNLCLQTVFVFIMIIDLVVASCVYNMITFVV